MLESLASMDDPPTSFQFAAHDPASEVGHATIFENLPLTPPRSFAQDGNFAKNSYVPDGSYSHKGSRSFNFSRTAPFPLSPLGQAPSPPDSLNTTLASVPTLPPNSESDRKAAFTRHSSFTYAAKDASQGPFLSRNVSSLNQHPKSRRALNRIVSMDRGQTPHVFSAEEDMWKGHFVMTDVETSTMLTSSVEVPHKSNLWSGWLWSFVIRMTKAAISGNRATRRLLLLIMLNVAYSSVELLVGLFSRRVGLVSDAFHLTFGCGLLSFSLIAMNFAKTMHDDVYTYGYKRLEVLAAFTNALFLLFLSFSLAVEALHAFIQDESEHKHYLIISAATNLLVNVLGVWFFRSYARIRIVYRKAEDMNHHSIFLHVLSDSIRSAGLILASWLLTLGVKNAETLCLGLVAVTVFLVVMPLFKATAGILLQMAPTGISVSAFNKCLRQVTMLEDVLECCQPRFWEMVPGFVVGTLALRVKEGADEQKVLKYVHSVYNDIGIKDLTVQIDMEH